MGEQSFIALVKRYYPWICSMEKAAFRIYDGVNQKYDHILPCGFHLKMTISYVSRYGYLVAEIEAGIPILYVSAFLHDTIEDARMACNNVVKFLKEFKGGGFVLPEGVRQHLEDQVPEVVYALTNEKGRNQGERANDLYYQGIRQTKLAFLIKICDRLANIQYTVMFVFTSRMLDVCHKEHPEFIQSISEGVVAQVPGAMKEEAKRLLNSESYIIQSSQVSFFQKSIRNDEDLLTSLGQRSEDTFIVIYGQYHELLYVLAYKYLKGTYSSEDAVQQVFPKLWKARSLLMINVNLRNYLYIMLKNHVLNEIRNSNSTIEKNYEIVQSAPEYEDELLTKMEEQDMTSHSCQAIDHLPEQKHQACPHRLKGGLSNREVADKMNISVLTVKTHYAQTIKILWAHFERLFLFLLYLWNSPY